jgi:hypothetical protein
MKVELRSIHDYWQQVKNAAMNTIGKDAGKEPSSEWKRKILLSEHSPIRLIKIHWRWLDLKSWVSVHFVRHKFGIEHWVSTQRSDRTGINRDNQPQGTLVNHECEANAQSMINISRKRLCFQASPETRQAWEEVKEKTKEIEPELAKCMVKDCIYRGYCYEYKSCGYFRTDEFKKELEEYRKGINEE